MARHLAHQVLADHSGVTTCSPKLTEGTVSTDLLVVYPPFPFFFLDPTYMGQGSGAQGTNRGFNQLKKGHEAVRVTLPLRDF